jgi:hypothetical protein
MWTDHPVALVINYIHVSTPPPWEREAAFIAMIFIDKWHA